MAAQMQATSFLYSVTNHRVEFMLPLQKFHGSTFSANRDLAVTAVIYNIVIGVNFHLSTTFFHIFART